MMRIIDLSVKVGINFQLLFPGFEINYSNTTAIAIVDLTKIYIFNFNLNFDDFVIFATNYLVVGASVTRLGDFWKFYVTNYLSKEAQMFGDFWGIFKTSLFK